MSGATAEDGFSVSGMKMAVSTILASCSEVVTLRREAPPTHIPSELACCEARTAEERGVLTSAPLSLLSNSESKTYEQAVLVNSR